MYPWTNSKQTFFLHYTSPAPQQQPEQPIGVSPPQVFCPESGLMLGHRHTSQHHLYWVRRVNLTQEDICQAWLTCELGNLHASQFFLSLSFSGV